MPSSPRSLALALLLGAACSPRPPPPPAGPAGPDGGPAALASVEAPDAGGPVPAAPVDAGPAPLPVTAAAVVVGGQDLPLARDGASVVDPAASFRIEVAAQITDGRLALHDEQDAMVASTGTTELGASRTVFRLSPDAPLAPGSAYTLQLDGAVTREAHDPAGRAYAPLLVSLRTSGERPRPVIRKKGRR